MNSSDETDEAEISPHPVANMIDVAILMHRDAHFSGDFPAMLRYYQSGGKGVNPEFVPERIAELADIEVRSGQNLAAMLLSGADAENVQRAKEAYKTLRDLYEVSKSKTKIPRLIADLILSEEEHPEQEMAAIVAEKGAIVPALIDLLRSPDYYDPLFPGYGLAPALAAECLGLIGDRRAVISLFEIIGEADFFNEDAILAALKGIGEPAKEFLLKVVHGRPLNIDNERAAIALIQFKDDPEVAKACFAMLQEPDVRKDIPLSTYLILACEGLQGEEERKKFLALMDDPSFSKALKQDLKAVAGAWDK